MITCTYVCCYIYNEKLLNQACTWFLELVFVCDVGMCVFVFVLSTSKAINYIHMIMNLYNQLNKLIVFRNIMKQFYVCMGVTIVTKHIATETSLIRIC